MANIWFVILSPSCPFAKKVAKVRKLKEIMDFFVNISNLNTDIHSNNRQYTLPKVAKLSKALQCAISQN